MKRISLIFSYIILACAMSAESWDYIRTSGEYLYGVGTAATEKEAENAALADLLSRIATHAASDFIQIDDVSTRNGDVQHQSRVLNCVKTYSQATLSNTEIWVDGKEPNIKVRMFIKKSELARIFDNRIAKAKDMLRIADECLNMQKIDMALQYYYWAYSLIRSVQYPNEVKDKHGNIIVNRIPVKIDEILSDIKVECTSTDGDLIHLSFQYKGKPVSSLEFSYSDGRAICQGMAKNGKGLMEMIPDYKTDTYHIDIEYEYKSQARGDAEMESVLNVITPKSFPKSSIVVSSRKQNTSQHHSNNSATINNQGNVRNMVARVLQQSGDKEDIQRDIINTIGIAISSKQYASIAQFFTINALEQFNRLTSYGNARIIDDSKIRFYNSTDNKTIARGLQMSFAFNGRRKITFVEDVSFTFNRDNKIENVAFGLGEAAENGIFNKDVQWPKEVSEIIVSFMENYKTAYCLERIDYIKSIFDDEAIIIVGNVAKKNITNSFNPENRTISNNGKEIISYNRYTKDQYIANLQRCFNRNDFINLKFTDHEVQWLEKYENETLFAINIRQQYNSSTYADDGYLFLMVDMTDRANPMIKVRTWQPNEVSLEKLYKAGDFYKD